MKSRSSRLHSRSLDDRFRFDEDSLRMGGVLESRLRLATDIETGERCLVRLFPKTGTAIDSDLRQLVDGGLRRIRRVLASRRAREVLVEVVEVVEDERELGIVMVDPGTPLFGSPRKVLTRRQLCRSNGGRRNFWRNMARVVEALAYCHDANIVHGAIDEHVIFAIADEFPCYRLGGYEACVHIADEDLSRSAGLRASAPLSFRRDLADVAKVVNAVLGLGEPGAPVLTSIEQRMLSRLADPPVFQLYDGHVALADMNEVIEELGRLGASIDSELVLYPGRDALRVDLPSLASGAVPASDVEAVMRFVSDDLVGPETRAVIGDHRDIRLVTDLATYRVEVVDERIGQIVRGSKRRFDDRVEDGFEIGQRVYLARNRAAAEERVRKLGNGAQAWRELGQSQVANSGADDPPSWYALILLETFTLLRQQFRTYPVDVLTPPPGYVDLVWLAPRTDPDREARRQQLKLLPLHAALRKEMDNDEGRPEWTVAATDQIGRPRDRVPELTLEDTGEIEGRRAYGFRSSEPVPPSQQLFLRPRADSGTESAIRRRLQNVMAARGNVELLRALDDPASVAMDEALRSVAAPGPPPGSLDRTKQKAWDAIAAGQSINVVVGPPGVGKTYLIAQLIKSILEGTPNARVLVAAQNHETLATIEHELKTELSPADRIVIRVEKAEVKPEATVLRQHSMQFLRTVARENATGPLANPYREIQQTLSPQDVAERSIAERVLRDTDNLLLRATDVLLATTSSPTLEELIAEGEQFDWVFIEEAARANGAELIGALLLGNRRVMIGDHRQLSPFEADERQKYYDPVRADDMLRDGMQRLEAIPDLPAEVGLALERLKHDRPFLLDVLAAAARFEEPFRSIVEREEQREASTGRPSSVAQTLLEQSRMHPTICRVVSNSFYGGKLVPSDRVKERAPTVGVERGFPGTPIVVLDLPPLSMSKTRAFEERAKKALSNPIEAQALVRALDQISPLAGEDADPPSLVLLAPYSGQVERIERLVRPMVDGEGRLRGFVSPRGDGRFVYTSDSFQGGQADVVLASLVRNNVDFGGRALGFLKNPQRLNVLLSRAKQKLILATSLQFFFDAVEGANGDSASLDLSFVQDLVRELRLPVGPEDDGIAGSITIVPLSERGTRIP